MKRSFVMWHDKCVVRQFDRIHKEIYSYLYSDFDVYEYVRMMYVHLHCRIVCRMGTKEKCKCAHNRIKQRIFWYWYSRKNVARYEYARTKNTCNNESNVKMVLFVCECRNLKCIFIKFFFFFFQIPILTLLVVYVMFTRLQSNVEQRPIRVRYKTLLNFSARIVARG